MTNAWSAVALISAVLMAGCYGSGGQTKDGQSHWIDVCESQDDCSTGQLCACGVSGVARPLTSS